MPWPPKYTRQPSRVVSFPNRRTMTLRSGFQSFEFQRAFELPKPLNFGSHDEAVKWLKQVGFLHSGAVQRLREYLARLADDPECFRLTDHDAIEKMATFLYARRVVVVAREQRAGSDGSTAKSAPIPVAYPLSERVTHAPSSSAKPVTVEDPPTFDQKNDPVVQAAALVAAANDAKPFCAEGEKAKAAAAGSSN